MRLVSYVRAADVSTSFGVVIGEDAIIDARQVIGGDVSDLGELLRTQRLDELEKAVEGRQPTDRLTQVRLLPPIPNPAKILCVGLNYRSHVAETDRPPMQYPTLFSRYADSQMGHLASAEIPPESTQFDYEGELAVVIGAPARRIAPADAMAVVAGYSVYNDFSARDWQRHTSQFLPGKNFPSTGGFGPWLITADEVPNVEHSVLTTRVNGEVRQNAPISDLIFDIAHLIAYISTFTPLAPGDVIVTGTPGGVGLFMDPPIFLTAGDVVEVEIDGVGTLSNIVAST